MWFFNHNYSHSAKFFFVFSFLCSMVNHNRNPSRSNQHEAVHACFALYFIIDLVDIVCLIQSKLTTRSCYRHLKPTIEKSCWAIRDIWKIVGWPWNQNEVCAQHDQYQWKTYHIGSDSTVKQHWKELYLMGSGPTTQLLPYTTKKQLVLNQMNKDPVKQHGVHTIQHKIAFHEKIYLTKCVLQVVFV